jgi:peptidoglycan/xylan/chitin deacetylase (PgdA/CDA1 family)
MEVKPWWCDNNSKAVIDLFLEEAVPVNVGIVGEDLHNAVLLDTYLRGLAGNPLVEMSSNSFIHQSYEHNTYEWQFNDMQLNDEMITNVTTEKATSFMPPWANYDDNTISAALANGMNVLSAECRWNLNSNGTTTHCKDKSKVVAPNIMRDGIYMLPAGAVLGGYGYWEDYVKDANLTEAITWIELQIEMQGFSVVKLHPVEFATTYGCDDLSPTKMQVLRDLIAYGRSRWQFKTFADAVTTISVSPTPTMHPSPAAALSQQPSIAAARSPEPSIPAALSFAPSIPAALSQQPSIAAARSPKPSIPAARSLQPTVAAARSSAPSIPAALSSAPSIPAALSFQPSIVAARSPEPSIPAALSSAPSIPAARSFAPSAEPTLISQLGSSSSFVNDLVTSPLMLSIIAFVFVSSIMGVVFVYQKYRSHDDLTFESRPRRAAAFSANNSKLPRMSSSEMTRFSALGIEPPAPDFTYSTVFDENSGTMEMVPSSPMGDDGRHLI